MSNPSLSFGGKIPQNYEDFLGPFIFEPFAADLANRLDWKGVQQVLELACGSGRLTKHLTENLPDGTLFTATDLNADVISVARSKVKSSKVTWTTADMMNIPFDENQFDLVVCQFGVMLVPDQQKALAEIFRVLRPGGKVVFSTWADLLANKLWLISDKVLNEYLAKSTIRSNPGPFSMSDADGVIELLRQTGFKEIISQAVDKYGEIATASMAAYGFIQGLPVSSFIQNENPSLMDDIIEAFEHALIKEIGDRPLKVSQRALVFQACKQS
ncbi:class I SAM-dependent methyltransferase [Mucilaginibacter aquaedulcis]|uniref:class I SAM-dependent methyltransferase n=1 Tax=Mucilaginibacter aquaedulcis TaxID=1187081 RepID=UPI0025B4A5BE|nr:class I SAM-dependent methyltransferase [Mucilaginibacter aquaedulcis]MDN3548888.1 methyltransferase domain-containing protein [Mucilaginibacter aquaedulcis]